MRGERTMTIIERRDELDAMLDQASGEERDKATNLLLGWLASCVTDEQWTAGLRHAMTALY